MQIYQVEIEVLSDFGTPLAGDTLFGHLCWRLAEDDSLVGNLDSLLSDYETSPFLVTSDGFEVRSSKWQLPMPAIPLHKISGYKDIDPKEFKKIKSLSWQPGSVLDISMGSFQNSQNNIQDIEAIPFETYRDRNSINRLSGTTGEDGFAPFSSKVITYPKGYRLAFLVATDSTKKAGIQEALQRTGQYGYGKDASIGLGKFRIVEFQEAKKISPTDSNWFFSTGPTVPKEDEIQDYWMEPVTRFGKHGGKLVETPFKNPVLSARSGSVFQIKSPHSIHGYSILGKGLRGVSSDPKTVTQGYGIAIPTSWRHSQ